MCNSQSVIWLGLLYWKHFSSRNKFVLIRQTLKFLIILRARPAGLLNLRIDQIRLTIVRSEMLDVSRGCVNLFQLLILFSSNTQMFIQTLWWSEFILCGFQFTGICANSQLQMSSDQSQLCSLCVYHILVFLATFDSCKLSDLND